MSGIGGAGGAGGLPPLTVPVVLTASGTASVTKALGAVNGATNATASSFARMAVPARQMGDAMRQMTSLIKYGLLQGIMNLGSQSIQTARQFELSMSRIRGLVGISADQVAIYKKTVLDLGGQTAKAPIELADALYFITSAGIKGSKALEVLKESAQSAAAGLGETKVVADALTSILNAYGQANYSAAKANDILVATVREGKAEADKFAPALGKVLPVSAAFGASFEDVSAGVAALTRNGASAGTAAIYLRQVLSQLLKPSKQASDTLFAAGTSAEELRTKIQQEGLLTALEYLNQKLGGSQYEVASQGLTKVFGNVRALTAVFSLLGPNLEQNRIIFDEINNSAGDADRAFQTYTQTADYKFKKALANSQAALISLGDALMPIASTLLTAGSALASFGRSILNVLNSVPELGRLTKIFLFVSASVIMLAKSGLFLFGKFQTLFRLFTQMNIVLKGFGFGVRMQSSAVAGLGKSFSRLGVASTEQVAIQNALTAAIASNSTATTAGTISQKEALLITAANTTNKELQTIATNAAAVATTNQSIANEAEAMTAIEAAIANKALSASLKTMIPYIGYAIAIVSVFATVFGGMFRKKKKNEGLDSDIKAISDLTEVLGGAVKLDAVNVTVNFQTNLNGQQTNAFGLTDEELKTLEEDILKPAGIDESIKNAIDTFGRGSDEASAFAVAIANRLGLEGPAKAKLEGYLAQKLGISKDVFSNVSFDMKGNTDVQKTVAAQVASVLIGLDDINKETKKRLEKADLTQSADALAAIFEPIKNTSGRTSGEVEDIANFVEKFGKDIGGSFDEGVTAGGERAQGALLVFTEGLNQVATALAATGNDTDFQAKQFDTFTESALKSITSLGDFKNENDGLRAVLASTENRDALIGIFTGITGDAKTATEVTENLQETFSKLGEDATPQEQVKALTDALNENVGETRRLTTETDKYIYSAGEQFSAITDIAGTFENGLNPAIQGAVDEYNLLSDTLDKIMKGYEAIAGLTQTGLNAEIDYAKSVRDTAEALGKSGGSLNIYTDAGADAVKSIEEYGKNLQLLAGTQVMDPEKGMAVASATITEGYGRILNDLITNGKMTREEAVKALKEIGLDPGSMIAALTGEGSSTDSGTTDQTLLNKISEGIVTGAGRAAEAAGPGVKEFNDALVKQIEDYWDIASPSKNAAIWIGEPIMKGIINGLTGKKSRDYAKKMIPKIVQSIKNEFTNNPVTVTITRPEMGGGVAGRRATIGGGNFRVDPNDPLHGGASSVVSGAYAATILSGTQWKDIVKNLFKQSGAALKSTVKTYLKAIKDYETPFSDLINQVIGDTNDALGTIGSYISAQISLNEAVAENTKLVNEQLLLQRDLAKAQREQSRNQRKFGAEMGAAVTDYEQARIEDLQKAYEKVQRDYALRRASIADLIDAEDALNEALAASTEISPDLVESQNALVDAQLKQKNAGLEQSQAVYNAVKAQKELTDAAIQFAIQGPNAQRVFESFANQVFPDLRYQISISTGTIYQAGKALTDPNGGFQQALRGLGDTIFKFISNAVKEAIGASTVKDFVPAATPIVDTTAGTGGTGGAQVTGGVSFGQNYGITATKGFVAPPLTQAQTEQIAAAITEITIPRVNAPGVIGYGDLVRGIIDNVRFMAQGGLVTKPTLAVVGEGGPELVLPLNGLGVTTALENLAMNRPVTSASGGSTNQVFNIEVNNPIPETASDSIGRRMRSLATAGLFG